MEITIKTNGERETIVYFCENGRETDRRVAYFLPEINRKADLLYHCFCFVCVLFSKTLTSFDTVAWT